MWLSDSDTKNPCQTNGTVEVMVWTDYSARALLPDSMIVGTATVPFAANGILHPGFDAWTIYADNVYQGGRTAPWGGAVWLVINHTDALRNGTITVDLSMALAAVDQLLQHNYSWSSLEGNYWLDTIAFGMEFGLDSGDPYGAGPTNFSLTVRSFCLDLKTTVSKAAC
jgi:hypothetical protein